MLFTDPALGFHHSIQVYRENLTLDILEPPFVLIWMPFPLGYSLNCAWMFFLHKECQYAYSQKTVEKSRVSV